MTQVTPWEAKEGGTGPRSGLVPPLLPPKGALESSSAVEVPELWVIWLQGLQACECEGPQKAKKSNLQGCG